MGVVKSGVDGRADLEDVEDAPEEESEAEIMLSPLAIMSFKARALSEG